MNVNDDALERMSQDAIRHCENEEYRPAADTFLKAFETAPSKWHPERYSFVYWYCSIFTHRRRHIKPSPADWKALKRILKDQEELNICRAEAVLTLGKLQWYDHRHEDAGDSFRDVIGFADRLASDDREREHAFNAPSNRGGGSSNGSNWSDYRAEDILRDMARDAQSHLDRLVSPYVDESQPNRFVKTEAFILADGIELPENGRQTKFCIGPRGVSITSPSIRRLLTVGGQACDVCGMSRQDAEMVCLDCCSRCLRVYFCSTACQRQRWPEHRQYCRKRGEIRAGDFMVMWGLEKKPSLNGEVVQIKGPAPNNQADRWAVTRPGHGNAMSISADKLYHLRPLK